MEPTGGNRSRLPKQSLGDQHFRVEATETHSRAEFDTTTGILMLPCESCSAAAFGGSLSHKSPASCRAQLAQNTSWRRLLSQPQVWEAASQAAQEPAPFRVTSAVSLPPT